MVEGVDGVEDVQVDHGVAPEREELVAEGRFAVVAAREVVRLALVVGDVGPIDGGDGIQEVEEGAAEGRVAEDEEADDSRAVLLDDVVRVADAAPGRAFALVDLLDEELAEEDAEVDDVVGGASASHSRRSGKADATRRQMRPWVWRL